MTRSFKRLLSMILAVVMVVGMLPLNVFEVSAAETPVVGSTVTTPNNVRPDAPDGYWYELDSTVGPNNAGYSAVCELWNHDHTDSCYSKKCDHKDGHLSTCYLSSTAYTLCPDASSHAHTGTADLADVVTISGNNVTWKTEHPAYPAIYAIYKAAYDSTESGKWTGDLPKKIAGVAAIAGKTVCYTTTQGEEPICGHTCSEMYDEDGNPGGCYEFAALCLKYEHTHKETDNTETSCYRYTWRLYEDKNGNKTGDGTEADPYYTITYKGFGDVVLKEYQAVAGVATPAYDGSTPQRDYYTFKDWGTVADTVTGNAEYTATWNPIRDEDNDGVADEEDDFVITWDNADGAWADGSADTVKTQTENYGATLTAPEVVAPADHFFSGWSPAVDKVTKTVTYTAQYTKDTIVTVTYKVDADTIYVIDGVEQKFEINITDNGTVPSVKAPTKTDWLFTGWTNADKIGEIPSADVALVAQWVADKNNNGRADSTETVSITVSVTNGTAVLSNGGNGKIIITNNGSGSYTVVYDSSDNTNGGRILVETTAKTGETTNVAYYLTEILAGDTNVTASKSFTAANTTVDVTFTKEAFELLSVPANGYVIKINGFSNETKAQADLKTLVLDELLGKNNYDAKQYKVYLKTSITIGSYTAPGDYYNVEGDTYDVNVAGYHITTLDLSKELILNSLVVDGTTGNLFKIVKLAASNKSNMDLYHEGVAVVAKEERESTDDITLSVTDYTENTLADVIDAIKGNVLVNGAAANVTVTLTPESALTTTKQTYTATVVAPGTKDYAESTKTFTVTATVKVYSVKWNPNNGSAVIVQTLPYGAAITTPAAPTKEGYTFTGWGEVADTVTGNVEYTAQWKINSYTVTWEINGEQYGDASTFEYGASVTAPTYNVPAGYTFTGWSAPETMPAENIVLEATQTPINYDVKWVYQTAEGQQTITASKPFGSAIEQPAIPLTYVSGNVTYTFAGWEGLADGATVPVDGVTYTAGYTTETAWVVEFNTNGGSTVTSQTIIAENNETVTKPADPTRDGYRFAGWYADSEVTTVYTFGQTPSENQTVYAKWVKQVTVSFEGAEIASQTFDINGTAAKPIDPDKEYAIFGGWLLNGEAYDFSAAVTADIVLTAKWIEDKNDNNKLDANETVTVAINKTGNGDGAVTLTGATDKVLVTDNGDCTWTVLYDSSENGSKTVNITAVAADSGSESVKNYLASCPSSIDVTVTNTVTAQFKLHSIPAVASPALNVNGKDADSKLADVTKKTVLEAVLGRTVTDAELAQYEVKVMVNTAGYDGYHDIWALIDQFAERDDAISKGILSALKGAFNTAIDVGSSEKFEITWLAHGIYPEVKGEYTVALNESRKPTTVTHNDDVVYTATALTDALLEQIQANLISNTTITKLSYVDPAQILNPGTTVDVQVIVNVQETDKLYGTSHTITVMVDVPADDIDIKIPTTATIHFNTGMSGTDKVALLKEKVPYISYVAGTDLITDDVVEKGFKVQYLASTARKVPYTINIKQMDLGIYGNVLPETIEVNIPVDAMWLDMATMGNDFPVYDAPSNELIKEIILNDLIPNYLDDYLAGTLDMEGLKDKAAELLADHPDIANYYKYMGAHQFGEQETETIRYVVDTQYGSKETNECVLSMVDDRAETEIKLNSGVEVTYNGYTEAELLALILDGVYADGAKIDGATVEFVTEVIGLPASEATEITVKFSGDENYKPSTATIAIKINKATVNVSVDNRLFKWQNGQFYTLADVISTNPSGVQTISFIGGLNISNVNLNEGLKGFVAQVQLMLPEELQSLLSTADVLLQNAGMDVSFANGASMKLSELKAAVEAMDGLFAGSEYEEYFRVLLNMLSSLPTEVADIEIIIGGDVPTDIGAYVVGAISADANYTTDFGVGAIVITPDGTKVDLAWNQNDDNYIVTNTLLSSGAFDTDAHAIKVYDERYTLDEATAQVGEIFLGVDIDGNITLEMDQSKLNVGAYVEIAMIVNFGNEMFYSEPLVRPIVVVAETLDVDFVDNSGAINNERHYEFFNVPQNGMEGNLLITYKQDGEGYKAGDEFVCPDGSTVSIKYYYVGVQTNGVPYASQQAPVHAGAYTITAIVVVRDNTGYITHAGQGVGALVIEPSKSTIDVENEAIKWDGEEHTVNGFVDADSVNVPGLKPDTTIISAGISADLDANIGLDAIKGNVNIDMPSWIDNMLKKLEVLEAGYTETGITAEVFLSYVEKLEAELTDLGVEVDAFNKIVDVIKQLPGKTVLTFKDNIGYKDVGVYLIVGVVTDSDHYPSADAGIMVIYPDAEKVDLQFNKTWDDNNVFTWQYLQSYDLNAKAYQLGTDIEIPAATEKVTNLFVGFADHGELVFTSDKTELDNGVYAQVAFILDLSNNPYYAEPISREVIIVPNNADIDFVDENGKVNNDRHFAFNAQQHSMNTIRVTLVDGTVLDLTVEDDRVDIFYVGVQSNGEPYAGYEAPVNAGVYEVTAQYTERDAQNRVIHLGTGVGVLVIEPSKSETTVENDVVVWDGNEHAVNDLVHASSNNVAGLIPDTAVISVGLSSNLDSINGLGSINGTVNVDMPNWMDSVMKKLNILEAGYANGISAEIFLSYADKIRAGMEEMGVDTASFDKIIELVEQLPINTNLTFKDNAAYSEIGAYLVIAVVTDFNHYPSVGAGILVIVPDAAKVDLAFEEDWNNNNIFTWSALENMDLEAKAYLNGVYNAAATEKIVNLYFGFTDNGEFLLNAVTYGESLKDVPEFDNGAYTQLAFIKDLGNAMYYAEPISRAFLIVPTPAEIIFVDDNGAQNNDRHFVFNNKPHAMDVQITVNGTVVTDLSGLTIRYVGVQTNGELWNSTEAPTHAGTYIVTATYTQRDAQNRLVTLGVAVGAMVIEPAKSTVDVDSKLHKFNNTGVSTDAMIHTGSVVEGITPDKTVITTSITSEGIQAIKGSVNVDFPAWVDAILNKYAPSIYGDGIPVGEFNEKVIAKLNEAVADVEALAKEYNIPADKLISALTAALAEVEKIVDRLPEDVILTFKEQSEVAPKEVGTYLIVGIVTDSDHYPSIGAGLLVIYPKVDEAELKWFYNDTNGIFTLPALKDIDMTANGYINGAENNDVTAMINYLTVGIDENGKLIVTNNPNSLTSNGTYTEVAYIPVEIGAEMTVAAPIMRSFIVVPQTVTVTITDTNTVFGDAYNVPVSVVDAENKAVTGERLDKYLSVTYIGIDGLYHSDAKPTKVGIYTVVATYIEKDANGEYTYVGMSVGTLTITPADADYTLNDKFVEHGTINAIDGMVSNANELPYAIYIVRNTAKGEVNVILPAGWEVTIPVGAGVDALIAAIEKLPAAIENTELMETLKSVLNSIDMQKLTVNGAQPSTCGEYDVTAIAFGNMNYNIATASAKLVVDHNAVTEKGYAAGCEDTGLTDGEHCSVCNKVLVAQEVIPATDHAWSVTYTWSEDGKTCTATHVCGNNAAHNETATATVTSKVTDDSTCTEKGETTYTATFTESWATTQTKVLKDVPATDHAWSVTYTWSEDGKTCTATHVCGNDAAHNETATATVTSKVTDDPTCTEKGETTYTATFAESWATTQTKVLKNVPATGHIDANEDHKCDNCGIEVGHVKAPTIGIPSLTGDNIYGFSVDYANKRIYIDTVKTGLTIEQFVQQLVVPVFNDTDNKAEILVSYLDETLTGTALIRTEAKVSLTAENEDGKITVVYDVVVIGDVNRNGEVDSGDASLIQRYFFKEVELTALQADAADTNRSGEIESGDAVKNQVKYNDTANYQSSLHSYTECISNNDATCENDGTMTLKCTANHNCSAKSITVPEAGSAKEHKYVLRDGMYVCDVCDKKKVPNV